MLINYYIEKGADNVAEPQHSDISERESDERNFWSNVL